MRDVVADLLRPEAYPPPRPARVEFASTHISWVFLTDAEAWKVKRPVDFGFLDFTTREARERACRDEVRLNRRLAPDVYLGVVPVREGPHGLAFTGDGPVVDHAVRMRRLPDACSARALLERGALGHDHLAMLAATMARFHAAARATPDSGSPAAVARTLRENVAQVEPFAGRFVDRALLDRVRARQEERLAALDGTLRRRAAEGRAREGHGDLRLEHVYFEEGRDAPTVIDCIEFNERFRCIDVAADVAFLAMELAARGRRDLGERFLGRYAEEADDFGLFAVADLYLCYRAWVRGKVACFVAADPTTEAAKSARKAAEARAQFALADRFTEPPSPPGPVIAVGGIVGTGKSTLAEAVARRLGLAVVASDRVRKRLAGIAPEERGDPSLYGPEFSGRTFDGVFARANEVVASGRGVILDMTFRARDLRSRAREFAASRGRPFLFVETRCDPDLARARLRTRAGGPSVSDAREDLLDRFAAEFEAVEEFPPAEHFVADTARPAQALAVEVAARVAVAGGR